MKRITSLLALALSLCAEPYAQSSPCPEQSSPGAHIVQPGETLSGISRRYQLRVSDLLAWNGIENARYIQPCQKIWLGPKPDQRSTKQWTHKGGDTQSAKDLAGGITVVKWKDGTEAPPVKTRQSALTYADTTRAESFRRALRRALARLDNNYRVNPSGELEFFAGGPWYEDCWLLRDVYFRNDAWELDAYIAALNRLGILTAHARLSDADAKEIVALSRKIKTWREGVIVTVNKAGYEIECGQTSGKALAPASAYSMEKISVGIAASANERRSSLRNTQRVVYAVKIGRLIACNSCESCLDAGASDACDVSDLLDATGDMERTVFEVNKSNRIAPGWYHFFEVQRAGGVEKIMRYRRLEIKESDHGKMISLD